MHDQGNNGGRCDDCQRHYKPFADFKEQVIFRRGTRHENILVLFALLTQPPDGYRPNDRGGGAKRSIS